MQKCNVLQILTYRRDSNVFRPGSYGKYSNNDVSAKPYMFSVMQTKSQWSSNTYMPYLKEADDAHLSKDSMGQRLVYGERHVVCSNAAYLLRDNETEAIIRSFPVSQNEEGIDTEDRIILLKELISSGALVAEYDMPEVQNDEESTDGSEIKEAD